MAKQVESEVATSAKTDSTAAPRRQRVSREERRRQLVEAAVRLIGASGIHGTTVSKISAEVGLSEMAAYRHFASKEEILMEADSYLVGRILEWLESSAEPCIIDRLCTIGERHFEMLSSDLEMYTAPYMQFLTMSQSDDPLHRHLAGNNDRMKERIVELLQEGIDQGSIRADIDPQLFTHEFVSWFLGEDLHALSDLRDGTFSRSSHLRMLDLILRDVAAPGYLRAGAEPEGPQATR